ncbi:MAG TPA: L-histidine N(alpha)-methyltransferase [Bryobacteraceae bacterium]|jgi:dimethylhistidine N-methyltransferase|nr:L-histidine N(alpha)-methyltransferase [Bryobacteraceae bacterium]
MPETIAPVVSQFAQDVADGLSNQRQKQLAPRYFYDDLGSALFEAITFLPEYGLTRADEHLLAAHASEIAERIGDIPLIAELGSGSGRKTRHILGAWQSRNERPVYRPIDVSSAALSACERELGGVSEYHPVNGEWLDGLAGISPERTGSAPLLLLFLGSSIGNLDRAEMLGFLRELRGHLRPGDFFLLGADLVKDVDRMLSAYDDPTGVTAAFNLNLLARINRELGGDFDLRSFTHEVRWDSAQRRIEMHLLSCRDQDVNVAALGTDFHFRGGETIWTESSHKFTEVELDGLALSTGFLPVDMWVDENWPFAEALWRVE